MPLKIIPYLLNWKQEGKWSRQNLTDFPLHMFKLYLPKEWTSFTERFLLCFCLHFSNILPEKCPSSFSRSQCPHSTGRSSHNKGWKAQRSSVRTLTSKLHRSEMLLCLNSSYCWGTTLAWYNWGQFWRIPDGVSGHESCCMPWKSFSRRMAGGPEETWSLSLNVSSVCFIV